MRSIVRVITPSPDELLTTVSRMKADLGISGVDQDDAIENLIEEASSRIVAYVGYPLGFATVEETFRPDRGYECVRQLLLERQPVYAIERVTIDDAEVASPEYEVSHKGAILYRLDASGHSAPWEFGKAIVVLYSGGYILPDDTDRTLEPAIENACAALVRTLWYGRRRDPLVKSVEIPGLISESYWVGATGDSTALPPDVELMLAPFKRMRL